MPRITGITAPLYNADLQYERDCKCGTTEVVKAGQSFNKSDDGDFGWKMIFLSATNTLGSSSLEIENMSSADQTTLEGLTFVVGDEIMGKISDFVVDTGTVIVYKDCNNS